MIKLLLFASSVALGSACVFAKPGMAPPNDVIHRHLSARAKDGSGAPAPYPVLPDPVSLGNNAFVTNDLQRAVPTLTGTDQPLVEALAEFEAANPHIGGEEGLCYWAWQGLPPPRGGGPTLLHPERAFWGLADGRRDQDIQWVQAYGDVAAARLHARVEAGGPVVGAMCTMGARLMRRRCSPSYPAEFGPARAAQCADAAVTGGAVQWPMAVSIWKVGHPQLWRAVQDWRADGRTGHTPNIEWVLHTGGGFSSPAYPWGRPGNSSSSSSSYSSSSDGTQPQAQAQSPSPPMPATGQVDPPGMPDGAGGWPRSEYTGWGTAKVAKVVRCADIPAAYKYNTAKVNTNYACDHVEEEAGAGSNSAAPTTTTTGTTGTTHTTTADAAYAAWRALPGVWPPTKECADDPAALDALLRAIGLGAPPLNLTGRGCAAALPALRRALPNFGCDNADTTPAFRGVCCSVCGAGPIPDVAAPRYHQPAPTTPPTSAKKKKKLRASKAAEATKAAEAAEKATSPNYQCTVCNHVYDADRDGNGLPFEQLPDTWRCPVCGAPKSAYTATATGQWAHTH